ncbi:MAG: succinyl-diaminopimelate desuccinylase [Gammaproteobacteria bacterium]|nr:succinyl-diaminopimelate desuccinylase [Gammaproteobacteria bacterium]MDH3412415.1 succinyl-diaminopimelate desuccinylase [Gammaproteobacteria bacterium]
MSPTLSLAMELIARPSVTPQDGGCQALIAKRLSAVGLDCQSMVFGDVANLWARRGNDAPLFVFLGHTDVVPTGPESEWETLPFEPTIRDGHLRGRGAADMKGSVAAFVTALERFIANHAAHGGSVGVLLTSDEEGDAVDGTVKVVETLGRRGEKIDWCLVGEPSSRARVGDVVKNGRRGSLTGRISVLGRQGHVAYPHQVVNPVHAFALGFSEMARTAWDAGNEDFPPTSFQISNVTAGTGVENVVPGSLEACFNFRYSTELTAESIKQRVAEILEKHGVQHRIQWTHGAKPFLTREGALVDAARNAIREVAGRETELSTEGGTSDGRFIAPTGAEVVELGPVNATIHKIDECVRVEDLDLLSQIYERVMEILLVGRRQ